MPTHPQVLFARAKTRVFESTLKPLGYVKGQAAYVHRAQPPPQLHLLEFQDDDVTPGQYFVNLGIGFDFLPAFMSADIAGIPTAEYHIVDLPFRSRIGSFVPGPYLDSWDYWDLDEAGIEALVKKNVTDCLHVFERYAREWADPRRFLDLFPPELIEEDHRLRRERDAAEKKKIPWNGTFPLAALIGKAWSWNHHHLAYACGIIAGRAQNRDLARRYMALARNVFPDMADGAHAKLRHRAGLAPADGQAGDVPDGHVRHTSCLGTSFVTPAGWTLEQEDDVLTLHAPDGRAVINAFRYEINAVADAAWHDATVTAGVLRKSKKWRDIPKSEVDIGPNKATRLDFYPKPEKHVCWRLYTYATPQFHHAILLEATNQAMSSNGGAYEAIIRTFHDGD